MKFGSLILLLAVLSSCWPSSISFKDKGSMPEEWKTFSVKTLEVLAPNAPLSYGANLTEQLKIRLKFVNTYIIKIFYLSKM
jgi:hypothetical protein